MKQTATFATTLLVGGGLVLLAVSLIIQVPSAYALEEEANNAAEQQQQRSLRSANSKCSAERERQMDICAARMGFLGDHSFTVPKNLTAMNSFCVTLKESIDCIQSYARECLHGFTRQILVGLLRRGKLQYNLICNNNNSKRDFLFKMACLKDNKIQQFHTCMDASIARFEYIASKVSPDNRLLSLCCSYQIFRHDVDTTLDQLCGKPTNQQRAGSTNEFVQKIVSGTTGEFLGLICDGHRSIEECQNSSKTSTYLIKLEETTARVKQGKLKAKNKSLIPPLLNILDSAPTSPV